MSRAARFDIFYQGRLYRKNLTAAEITKEFGCKSAWFTRQQIPDIRLIEFLKLKKFIRKTKRSWKISTKLRYLIILTKSGESARKLLKMSYGYRAEERG